MKKFSAILTLSALSALSLSAYAAPDTATGVARSDPHAASMQADQLPTVGLSKELMVKYLSAEIAEQRGNPAVAYAMMNAIARASRDPRLARRAVEIAMGGRMTAEALSASRLWTEIAPHSEEASQVFVSLLLTNSQLDEAKKILAQRLAAAPAVTLPRAIDQTQRILMRVPDKNKSAGLLRELLEPYRESLDAELTLAQLALASGDIATAQREARSATAKHPRSELAALTLAQMMTDKAEAGAFLTDFLKKNPAAREVRLAYARMLFEQARLAEAKAQFKHLLEYAPQDQTALYAAGLLSLQTRELADAENYLSAYIKTLNGKPDRDRDATQALMVLAQISEDRNDMPGALKWLDLIDVTAQDALAAILKRAQLLAKSGKTGEARKLLAQTETDSDDERIKLIIGEAQLLRDEGQLNESMRIIEDGLQRFPDNTDLLYEHAMVAEKNNQLVVMERSLRRIIKLAPDNPHAYNALGYALADRNQRLPEAYDLIKKALELAPADPYIMDSMGWVEFRLGRFEIAEALLRRAYAIKPDLEIAVHLGEVLWVRGREDEARQFWRNANTKDPKNETLKGTLKRLQVKM